MCQFTLLEQNGFSLEYRVHTTPRWDRLDEPMELERTDHENRIIDTTAPSVNLCPRDSSFALRSLAPRTFGSYIPKARWEGMFSDQVGLASEKSWLSSLDVLLFADVFSAALCGPAGISKH
jgi:hypothetical protein